LQGADRVLVRLLLRRQDHEPHRLQGLQYLRRMPERRLLQLRLLRSPLGSPANHAGLPSARTISSRTIAASEPVALVDPLDPPDPPGAMVGTGECGAGAQATTGRGASIPRGALPPAPPAEPSG